MFDKNNIYQESVREKLTFSPIDKYVKYDRFPTKLLIHILLVVLTTISAISLATSSNSKYKSQKEVWFNLVNLDPTEPRNHLYSVPALQTHLNNTLNSLTQINDIIFQEIEVSDAQYSLTVEYLYPGSHVPKDNMTKFIQQGSIFKYYLKNVSEGISNPFYLNDTDSLKSFTQQIKSFTFNANNLKLKKENIDELHSCWKLLLNYEMASFSHIMVSLSTLQRGCDEDEDDDGGGKTASLFMFASNDLKKTKDVIYSKPEKSPMGNILIFLNFIIFFLAFCSMILNWRYIYEMMNLYMDTRIRSKRKDIKRMADEDDDDPSYLVQLVSGKGEKNLEKLLESQKPWDQLTFREKLLFFDMWFIFCIMGNFIQIWASILSITADFGVESYKTKSVMDLLVGFSCWFAWLNLLRYLEYNKNIHLLTTVMRNSGPQILRFMIGFLPIFFAYVFLGVCLFWRYTKFESVNEAIITLFSLIMGDLVFATFYDVIGVGIVGELYLFSFIVLFIVCVHNIFVSIICSKAQEKKKLTKIPEEKSVRNLTFLQQQQSQGSMICECCKKNMQNLKESEIIEKSKERSNDGSDLDSKKNVYLRNNSRRLTGSAWENIAKGVQIKKYKNEENTGGLFLNKFEKFEEIKKKIFDQMILYRKEINYFLDEMRKDAIEDVDLYELKYGQKIALKKKYKQQMEYLKSKIKSLIDPLKL